MSDKEKPERPLLPPPPAYLKPDQAVTGLLVDYEQRKYSDNKIVIYLYVQNKKGAKITVRVGVSSGQMYQDLYELVNANTLPFKISISKSIDMKGRKIKLG